MKTPLLSVVIPTSGRPQLLPVAVNSALMCSPDSVEVIVVPNGPDASWKVALAPHLNDRRVRVDPIAKPHANSARNHGMSIALGKYLRFLDDDDFLYPEAALNQCCLLEKTGAEICSGGLDLCTADGAVFKTLKQPFTMDFVEAVLSCDRLTATTSHVYKRTALGETTWNESISLGQDTDWIHSLCRKREWSWARSDEISGVWRHHAGPRTSAKARAARHYKVSGQYLLQTIHSLIQDGRLTPARSKTAADGLWFGIHGAFFMDPVYWWNIARQTQLLFPESRPNIGFYRHPLGKNIPPLLLESVMVPKRWINHGIRQWKVRHGKLPPW